MYQCRVYLMMLSATHNHQSGKGKGEVVGMSSERWWGRRLWKDSIFYLAWEEKPLERFEQRRDLS